MDDPAVIIPPEDGFSDLLPIGYSNSSHCGYCQGGSGGSDSKRRFSYYASCSSISPGLYQVLVDRCWRRSGTLLYRPNQKDMCCPHYTLRLDANHFYASRDQRHAINRFNRFVIGDTYAKEAAVLHPRSREEAKRRETVFDLLTRVHEAESSQLPSLHPRKRASTKSATNRNPPAGQGADAADASGAAPAAEPTRPAHCFEVTLEPDTFSEEKYLIFENYQRVVHREPASRISRQGFASFLCDSPLRRETMTDPDGGGTRELGSFHQCYRLDGRLVAMGVLDLLPNGVSAVYFLYHESIHHHNPGKLGALREIALARERGYRWWYSGYYIHSCPKMRYKIDYIPQYVLDPETHKWDLLDNETLAIFDRQPYVSMSKERKRQALGAKLGDSDSEYSDGDSACSEDTIPLLESNMPGLPSRMMIDTLNLDNIPIRTNMYPDLFPVKLLAAWSSGTMEDGVTFKGRVTELVAAMGVDLMDSICLDFRTHKKKKY